MAKTFNSNLDRYGLQENDRKYFSDQGMAEPTTAPVTVEPTTAPVVTEPINYPTME